MRRIAAIEELVGILVATFVVSLVLTSTALGQLPPSGDEPVERVPPPNFSQLPVYGSTFANAYEFTGGGGRSSVAVGTVGTAARTFVVGEAANYIGVFDADNLTRVRNIALERPAKHITAYRGRLYVVLTDGRLVSYDAASGARVQDVGPFNLLRGLPEELRTLAFDFGGVDAAWGEVWVVFARAGAWGAPGGGVAVLDATTGALKHVTWSIPQYDCDFVSVTVDKTETCAYSVSSVGRDKIRVPAPLPDGRTSFTEPATIPEHSEVVTHCRFIFRDAALLGAPRPTLGVDTAGTRSCADNTFMQEGTDGVWGMSWFLEVRNGQINEYEILPPADPATGSDLVSRRSWQGNDLAQDVAYRPREARLDAEGALFSDAWMRGTKCLTYRVTDADIYLAGPRDERWYELARNFEKIELRIDGTLHASSTAAAGSLCANLNTVASGEHNMTLTAFVGTKQLTKSNPALRVDNDAPTGYLDNPDTRVQSIVDFHGRVADPHAGPGTWTFEVRPEGATAWQRPCVADETPDDTGRFSCSWDSESGAYPDGMYRLRAVMLDRSSDGGNTRTTAEVADVEVDNVSEPDPGTLGFDDAVDAFYESEGPPETDSEPAPVDDGSQGGLEGQSTYSTLECAPDDEYSQVLEPVYARQTPDSVGLPNATTPEIALTRFLAVGGPPVAAFVAEQQTADRVLYAARIDGELRALVDLHRDPTMDWTVERYLGCSQFPAEALGTGGTR